MVLCHCLVEKTQENHTNPAKTACPWLQNCNENHPHTQQQQCQPLNHHIWFFQYHVVCYVLQVAVSKISYNSNKLTNQMQQFHMFITWRFVSLNMFWAPPRPSSGACNCINSLWFYHWSVVVAALLVVVWTTTNNTATTMLQGKTRGC